MWVPAGYGPVLRFSGGQAHACQIPAILLLMHNGFEYIYDSRVKALTPA
jgi:hypothetical protein